MRAPFFRSSRSSIITDDRSYDSVPEVTSRAFRSRAGCQRDYRSDRRRSNDSAENLATNPSWRDAWLDWSWIFAAMPTTFTGIRFDACRAPSSGARSMAGGVWGLSFSTSRSNPARHPGAVDSLRASDTLGSMELNVPPDLETKLARVADRRGIAAETLVLEAIERAVEYDDWFLREVEKGLAQIERGKVLTHEDVGARLEKRLTLKQTHP